MDPGLRRGDGFGVWTFFQIDAGTIGLPDPITVIPAKAGIQETNGSRNPYRKRDFTA